MNKKRKYPINSMRGRWETDDAEGFGFEVVEHASEHAPERPVTPPKGVRLHEREFWLPTITDPRTKPLNKD